VKKAAAILKAHPDIDLTVTGNTDSSGPAAANLVLSRQRAHAVADALHADGIATSRLKVVGNGESKPKVPNNSPQHRATNRRVDLFAKGSPLG
jgi:outer membrane protein OmpA-like peptidoglycan-associated protein